MRGGGGGGGGGCWAQCACETDHRILFLGRVNVSSSSLRGGVGIVGERGIGQGSVGRRIRVCILQKRSFHSFVVWMMICSGV